VWQSLRLAWNNAILKVVLPDEVTDQEIGHPLPASPVFGRLKESLGIFTSDEITTEPEMLPLSNLLAGTRSLMILPIGSSENLHALFVQKDQTHHFSPAEWTGRALSPSRRDRTRMPSSPVDRGAAERLATSTRSVTRSAVRHSLRTYKAIHAAVERLMHPDAFVIALLDEGRVMSSRYIVDSGRITGVRLPYGKVLAGR
jgi:hypothetical protein